MDLTKLQQAVELAKQLKQINEDIRYANPPNGYSKSVICYAFYPDGNEAGLGTGREFNYERIVKDAVVKALEKKKADIEMAILAL